MRVILDTNLLISAMMSDKTPPAVALSLWRRRAFSLISSLYQVEELRQASRYAQVKARTRPVDFGRLINAMRHDAELVSTDRLPNRSPDPFDDFLLAMAEAGDADFLVTGDKAGLLALGSHGRTRIVTVRQFLEVA